MAKLSKPKFAPRNPVARSPLLAKGGAHKSEKSHSRVTPGQLKHHYDDWREELEFERSLKMDSDTPLESLLTIISKGLHFSREQLRLS